MAVHAKAIELAAINANRLLQLAGRAADRAGHATTYEETRAGAVGWRENLSHAFRVTRVGIPT
jgi:hypothetical protein